jgi:hypothetical protein
MGKMQIQFEETTLSEVLGTIESGFIQHQGDAADSLNWLCYTVVTDNYKSRVWIKSHGEMGGAEHRVTAVAVQRISSNVVPSDCPALPKQFQPLSFNNGIWLGATKTTVRKAFPSGLLFRREQAFIGYQGKVSDDGHCEGGYDLLNSLSLTFQGGLVVGIDAYQVTSC